MESASQEDLIKELRLKLEEAEKKSTQEQDEETVQTVQKLRSELKEKQHALEEALENELQQQHFRERTLNLEHQIAEMVQHSFRTF